MALQEIDRHVHVHAEGDPAQAQTLRVSDLRDYPFVVLIGEPGIGKTTVFEQEAAREGTRVIKVRGLLTGMPPPAGATLYLDALDEFRADGQAADKAYGLARAIAEAGATRWRISCRSEDWRHEADIEPIRSTVGTQKIMIAQLLPLQWHEKRMLLAGLGETSPNAFLNNAFALGATAFAESPLSLTLLHRAVSADGVWPRSRSTLFAAAVRRMAHESNPAHQYGRRSSAQAIEDAAGRAFLMLLLCGARAVWRTSSEPPQEGGRVAFLAVDDLEIEHDLFLDMLDTPLFRGEGQSFEWIHRTVAEYLGGRALAALVKSSHGRPAIPLSRAIAWITGGDGPPPTELRGLFAWFCAHLAACGDEESVWRLIEVDLASVFMYGDSSALSSSARRIILDRIASSDPYFRTAEIGTTTIAGFIDEELAEHAAAVLTAPPDGTHRAFTLLDALTHGTPVRSLRPVLFALATDSERPDWMRKRSADAWLNGAPDPHAAGRELMDALWSEPVSVPREILRLHLAGRVGVLPLRDVKSMLRDYHLCGESNVVGRLFELRNYLTARPMPELFDEPLQAWLPEVSVRHRSELDTLLDEALKAAIKTTPGLQGERVWRWTVNVRSSLFTPLGSECIEGVQAWLASNPAHELQLYDAIADDPRLEARHMPTGMFRIVSNRLVSGRVVRVLLDRAAQARGVAEKRRHLSRAVEIVAPGAGSEAVYWAVHDALVGKKGFAKLLRSLTYVPFGPDRYQAYAYARRIDRQRRKEQESFIRRLQSMVQDLESGAAVPELEWAALQSFQPESEDGNQRSAPEYLAAMAIESIASAIAAGWENLFKQPLRCLKPEALGEAFALNRTLPEEWPLLAHLERVLQPAALPIDAASIPWGVELVVLKSASSIEVSERRAALFEWARERLDGEPERAKAQLVAFWRASLSSGATELPGFWRLVQHAKPHILACDALWMLLEAGQALPMDLLQRCLSVLQEIYGLDQLHGLALLLQSDARLDAEQRMLWRLVAFVTDASDDLAVTGGDGESGLEELFADAFCLQLLKLVRTDGRRTQLADSVIRLTGPQSTPNEVDPWGHSISTVRRSARNCDAFIKDLRANPSLEASDALEALIREPSLHAWVPELRHALARQSRLHRDLVFRHPTLSEVRAAFLGGPPINGADLCAVVLEELRGIARELHTDTEGSWAQYWNTDAAGRAVDPKVENRCRDVVFSRLSDRLRKYQIAGISPEAQRLGGTRADVVVFSHAGRALPIEAKRHYHEEVWTAAATQLSGYASASDADGIGIYLVFWFGVEFAMPPRGEGQALPQSASEMESMLREGLPDQLRAVTPIVVMDVSRPVTTRTAGAIRGRSGRAANTP